MTHVTITVEQWNQLLSIFGWLAVAGGFLAVAVLVDVFDRIDRFRWSCRRRARLARRRAKVVPRA